MTTNLYTQLADLFKQPPLQSGVVTVVGDSSVTVALDGGGNVTALGSASVGAAVYVRNGALVSAAPTLPEYDITI